MFMNGVLGGLVGIIAGADQMSPTDVTLGIWGNRWSSALCIINRIIKIDDPGWELYINNFGIWGTLVLEFLVFGQV